MLNNTITAFFSECSQYKTNFDCYSLDAAYYHNYSLTPCLPSEKIMALDLLYKLKIPNDNKPLFIPSKLTFHDICFIIARYMICPPIYKDLLSIKNISSQISINGFLTMYDTNIKAKILGLYLEFLCGSDISITIGDLKLSVLDNELQHIFENCFQFYIDRDIIDDNGNLIYESRNFMFSLS